MAPQRLDSNVGVVLAGMEEGSPGDILTVLTLTRERLSTNQRPALAPADQSYDEMRQQTQYLPQSPILPLTQTSGRCLMSECQPRYLSRGMKTLAQSVVILLWDHPQSWERETGPWVMPSLPTQPWVVPSAEPTLDGFILREICILDKKTSSSHDQPGSSSLSAAQAEWSRHIFTFLGF